MRPVRQTLAASGLTPWVMIDYLQATFNAGVAVLPASGGTLTAAKVEFTMDDLARYTQCSWSETTTTATITYPTHGLSVADSVILRNSGTSLPAGLTQIDGTYQVASIVDVNNFTVTVVPSQSVTLGGVDVSLARVFTAPAPLASITARTNANIVVPAYACRLNTLGGQTGTCDFLVMQGT